MARSEGARSGRPISRANWKSRARLLGYPKRWTGSKRSIAAPQYPTIAEQGYPGFEVTSWYALMAPAKTPQAIVARLNATTNEVLQAPDVRDKLMQNGEIALGTLTEAGELYAKEYKTWPGVVKKAGIKPT